MGLVQKNHFDTLPRYNRRYLIIRTFLNFIDTYVINKVSLYCYIFISTNLKKKLFDYKYIKNQFLAICII